MNPKAKECLAFGLVVGLLAVLVGALTYKQIINRDSAPVHRNYRVTTTDWQTLTNGIAMCWGIPELKL